MPFRDCPKCGKRFERKSHYEKHVYHKKNPCNPNYLSNTTDVNKNDDLNDDLNEDISFKDMYYKVVSDNLEQIKKIKKLEQQIIENKKMEQQKINNIIDLFKNNQHYKQFKIIIEYITKLQ